VKEGYHALVVQSVTPAGSSIIVRVGRDTPTSLLVGALSDCLTFTLQAHQLHQVPRFVD
jgi:hypothetical protein